jgi:hypothetical protein
MGVLQSSKVAAGMRVLADHFNKLWDDMITNHDHSTGKGAVINHANLSDSGAMSGFDYGHTDIDAHINASSAHGLPVEANVIGGPDSYVIVAGAKALPGTNGTCYFSSDGEPPGFPLSTVLSIVLTCNGPTGTPFLNKHILEVESIDLVNNSFKYLIAVSGAPRASYMYFIVVGTKA